MSLLLEKKPKNIEVILNMLRAGSVVILPTDNVYGLVTNGDFSESVERIYALKGRDHSKPLCYYTTPEGANQWGCLDERANKIIDLWPEAVSLIVPKKASVPDYITSDMDSVLLVCIDPFVEELARKAEFPIVATSANLSNEPAITEFEKACQQFMGKVDLIIDGGSSKKGQASTIVNLAAEPPFIQRQGPIPAELLQALIPELLTS